MSLLSMSPILRTLRRAINQQTRLASSGVRLNELPTRRRTSREIILLFRRIIGILKHPPEPENIIGYINRELDNTLPNVRSPHIVYERVISFLVGRKYAEEAMNIYNRMDDAGFLCPTVLHTKLLAIALALPYKSTQPLMLYFQPIFAHPRYTENDLSSLLKTMAKYEVDKKIMCTVVEMFISIRRPDRIRPEFLAPLLSVRARSGDVDVVLELMDYYLGVNNLNRAARASVHAPYVEVLATLRKTRTWDSASVNRILDLMTTQGLSLSLTTLNVLLSRDVALGNYQSALAIYSLLKEMRETRNISPDSLTFGTMFLLYRTIRPKIVRKHHRKDLASPFPPRALYRDFMLAVKPKDKAHRIVPSTTLMNVILRAFVRQRDYAGAFVVLNSFSLFKIPLDHRTYYCIIKHVIRRIWLEISKQFRGWSIMFLGVPDFRQVELNEDLVENLFAFVSQDTFRLISPLYASGRRMPPTNNNRRYKLPSMETMESVLPNPRAFHYNPVPLKRILRRAILATFLLEGHNAGPAEVSKAIADAKVEMLPKIPQPKHSPASMD